MAFALPNAWYISSAGWSAVSAWATSHSYAAGALVRQNATPTVGNERVFVCVVAGTSNSSEPSWTITKGAKTTDNTVTWQECTGQPAVNGDLTNQNTAWVASSSATLGLIIYDSTSGALQIVSTSGTSKSGTQPTFSATAGVTTTDNTATWTSLGAASGFTKWLAPAARGQVVFTANWGAAGNDFYVADNHAENVTSNDITWAVPGTTSSSACRVLCVSHTASVPPTAVTTGATVTTTTSGSITVGSVSATFAYIYGVSFSAAGTGAVELATTSGCNIYMDNCALSGKAIQLGALGGNVYVTWNNTPVTITGGSANQIFCFGTILYWKNTTGNSFPGGSGYVLFEFEGNSVSDILVEGVDLSTVSNGSLIYPPSSGEYACFKDCKLPSNLTAAQITLSGSPLIYDIVRCDSGATNYRNEHHTPQGDETTSTIVYRTGGASDGTTPIAHQIISNGSPTQWQPFAAIPISQWNATTGSTVTVKLYGLAVASGLPTDAEAWFDVEYLGSGSSPLGSFEFGGLTNPLGSGSSLTADTTSAWNAGATVRANSATTWTAGNMSATPPTLGTVLSQSGSQTGAVFFVVGGSGTAASSPPSNYSANANGGSTFSDGSYTIQQGYRFSLTLTLSPNPGQVGYVYVYPKVGQANAIFFIDPLVVL